jgi:chemotaxis protein methyltransferase CheR
MTDSEFALFQAYVERECAMALSSDKKYLFESRLARLLVEHSCQSFTDLYRQLRDSNDTTVRDRIIDAITTHETLWFRDDTSWMGLQEHALPALVQDAARAGRNCIKMWSAACSTGQEPYSLAMIADQFSRKNAGMQLNQFEITATDISPSALFVAKAGRYDTISMARGFGPNWEHMRALYFKQMGNISTIDSRLQSTVAFKRFNLQDSFAQFALQDLVLLRNVAIYFSDAFKRDLFARLAAAIRPGGLLILGSTEAVVDDGHHFEVARMGSAFCYRRTSGGAR